MYSVVIPFLSKGKHIQRCLNALHENSVHPHEIILIVDEPDVYYAYNSGVYKAKYDTVVLMNDDMVVAKGWDKDIPKYAGEGKILTGYVVEPNAEPYPGGPSAISYDCGDLNTFDADKFNAFVQEHSKTTSEYVDNALGWLMPIIVNKKTFITYPNIHKFPNPGDVSMINMVKKCEEQYQFGVIKMYVYHFATRAKSL